jgi:hypothetical protein
MYCAEKDITHMQTIVKKFKYFCSWNLIERVAHILRELLWKSLHTYLGSKKQFTYSLGAKGFHFNVFCHLLSTDLDQGCQIFRVSTYQNGKNIPNNQKLYQIAIKYMNIFHCKTLQNLPKFGFLVWKYTFWQFWLGPCLAPVQFMTIRFQGKSWVSPVFSQLFNHPRSFLPTLKFPPPKEISNASSVPSLKKKLLENDQT